MTGQVANDSIVSRNGVSAFPVLVSVTVETGPHNRLTSAFRPILAIPHAILVGPAFWIHRSGGVGLVGAAAYVMAIFSWFTLLIGGQQLAGIRDFTLYYLRWRVRALAYMALFTDTYPPFGDDRYPASISIADPRLPRDRTAIALRLLFALPHLLILSVLMIAWFVTTVMAWFAILFTGTYPQFLLFFGLGVMRWELRVEAYLLLLVDEFPPFSLD